MSDTDSPDQLQAYEQPTLASATTTPFFLYGELIKSKQTFLLVYTAFFAYLITAWSTGFNLSVFLWLNVGIFFAISGSTLLNMYIDRDIDALMERTRDRPLPMGKISSGTVLRHGILFTFAGLVAIAVFVDYLTTVVVFLGAFFDVVVYSLVLKRRTRFSIIFGGIAGGLPALAGATAVSASITLPGILMGLFVLCWIPLHILTLALLPKNLEGYRNAHIPMWPVIRSETQTIQVITLSAILSTVLIALTGITLNIRLLPLLPLFTFCFYMIWLSVKNLRNPTQVGTFRIFKLASMLMAIAFLWLFLGVVVSPP
ncbi:MAG: heme o synthase [Candidatus Hodarchaeales archaeon]|jgi:protoheme IX farnesyltransferase